MAAATWVWDKPGFPNTTAECRVADVCAVSPDYDEQTNTVTCNVAWTLTMDLYILLRGQSQDTVFVGVYPTLADAQNQTAASLIASYSGLVVDLTEAQDFTLIEGVYHPDLAGFHVSSVPVDLTPANPTWSVWKVAATATTPEGAPNITHEEYLDTHPVNEASLTVSQDVAVIVETVEQHVDYRTANTVHEERLDAREASEEA